MKKAVFFDRDGVLVPTYIRDGRPFAREDLKVSDIFEEAFPLIADLKKAGYVVTLATNQPDVATGAISQSMVEDFHKELLEALRLDFIGVCYHIDQDQCLCRKPKPGLLLEAARQLNIDLSKSFMVGDRWRDIDAGHNAGCKTIFLDHGYTERAPSRPADYTIRRLAELRAILLP